MYLNFKHTRDNGDAVSLTTSRRAAAAYENRTL